MNDLELLKIKYLKWLPWIGSNYASHPSKILIVGESHYGEDNEARIKELDNVETTRECIIDMGIENNAYGVKFYQNIHALLVGKKEFNTAQFWSRISFVNFIQKTMTTSGTRPDYADFHNSAGTFFNLLDKLQPDYCLMCGVSSINALRNTMGESNFLEIEFKKFEKIGNIYPRIMSIQSNGGKIIKLIFIQHPSHHFSYNNWGHFLRQQELSFMNQFVDL
jgi:hypothetical protein